MHMQPLLFQVSSSRNDARDFFNLRNMFAADKKTGSRRVKKIEKASPKKILTGETDRELNPQPSPTVKITVS